MNRPENWAAIEWISKSRRAPATWNFSAQVARDWEAAFFETPTPRTRKIALRSAITFSPVTGNAFVILSNLVQAGLGGKQGRGGQFVSSIHEEDFGRAVEFLIEHEELEGAVNIAAPHPLPNREFMEALREAWDVPMDCPRQPSAVEIGEVSCFNDDGIVDVISTATAHRFRCWRRLPV